MTRDHLDDAASKLFDAARQEQPSAAARERALAALGAGSSERRPRVAAAGWYAVVAVAAGFALLGVALARREPGDDALAIGPERPAHAGAPAHTARGVAQAPAPVSAPLPSAERVAPQRVASVNRATPSPAPSASLGLEQELELLDRARSELVGGNAAAALALLNRYQALPQTKSMSAEATLLRIQALSRSGRANDAARLARDFVNANPNSPLADRARGFISVEAQQPGGKPVKPAEAGE